MMVIGEAVVAGFSRWARPREPLSLAVPLAAGQLTDPERLVIRDGHASLPVQSRVTSRWPDGSLRWILLHTLADLPALKTKSLVLGIAEQAPPWMPPTLDPARQVWRVETGPLTFEVETTQPFAGPQAVQLGGVDAPLVCQPPRLTVAGQTVSVTPEATWTLVEPGPVRVFMVCEGRFESLGDGPGPAYRASLVAWAGRPEVCLDLTLIQDTSQAELALERFGFDLTGPASEAVTLRLGEGNYRTRIREARGGDGEGLERVIDADDLVFSPNEQTAELFHTDLFVNHAPDDAPGLAATVFQPLQQYPKALAVGPAGITVDLLPRIPGGTGPIVLRQGQAKTHRIQLAWHPAGTPASEVSHRSLLFQMPDEAVLPRAVYEAAGVFAEPVFPTRLHRLSEARLTQLADQRLRAYGWLHWGDGPDWSYTGQGRGRGALVWTNNEYDLPHVAWLHYVQTGERRFRAMAEVAAQHWLDVDIVHAHDDPRRVGGMVVHSAHHVSGSLSPCHEWVEGLLDTWHFTGRPEALEGARGIAAHVLQVLATNASLKVPGAAAARVTGWALRALVAMYRETAESQYREPADAIVEGFLAWHAEYGGFLAPYHDHTLCRVPFMIAIACGSLYRYHLALPDERVAALIPHEMDALIATCLRPDGAWVYKDVPSLHRRGAGAYVLEALAYAWDLTGDPKYLVAGLPTYQASLAPAATAGGSHRQPLPEEQTVLDGHGAGPKEYAALWLPLATFYRALAAAELLPPDLLGWLPDPALAQCLPTPDWAEPTG